MEKPVDQRLEDTKKKNKDQRLAGFKLEARQPRLATEANVEPGKKTRKRTEGAVAADQAKHKRDSSSVKRVDDGPTSLTSFGKIAESPLAAEKCIGDILVNKGATVSKPHLPPGGGAYAIIHRRWPTARQHSLYSDEDHFSPTAFSWSLGEEPMKRSSPTNFTQLVPLCWREVV